MESTFKGFISVLEKSYNNVCLHCLQPVGPGQAVNPVLKKCNQVLDPLTRAVPGLLEALYLMGKVKFLSGEQNFIICRDITFQVWFVLCVQRIT